MRLSNVQRICPNVAKGKRLALFSMPIAIMLIVAGCRESQSAFVSNCAANGHSNAQCSCAYDIANEALTDDQYELYSATVAGDRQRIGKASASLGFIDGATAATRILWVETNVESACRGL